MNVIPAKAGIQKYQTVTKALDPGFRRGDDFLRVHQNSITQNKPLFNKRLVMKIWEL
jgi:hypothetical protein